MSYSQARRYKDKKYTSNLEFETKSSRLPKLLSIVSLTSEPDNGIEFTKIMALHFVLVSQSAKHPTYPQIELMPK